LEGHESEVKHLDWDFSSKYLVSCSRDKSAWVWDYDNELEFGCFCVLDKHD
jgi:cytosolic iron-sulfur protein assembly protein CIAO1